MKKITSLYKSFIRLIDFDNRWPYFLLVYLVCCFAIEGFFLGSFILVGALLMPYIAANAVVLTFMMVIPILQIVLMLITFGRFDDKILDDFNDEIGNNAHLIAVPISLFFYYTVYKIFI